MLYLLEVTLVDKTKKFYGPFPSEQWAMDYGEHVDETILGVLKWEAKELIVVHHVVWR